MNPYISWGKEMKLGFIIIYVDDVKETLAFYQNAFGLTIRLEHEDNGQVLYGELETEGAILGFASHVMGEMNLNGHYEKVTLEKKPCGQEIVFVVDDINSSYNKALAAGAISIVEPAEKPWGQTVAYLRGKEGTLIELCTPMNGE